MVISTHPDQDHVCGLEVVLEELSVGQLLMHQPWRHSTALASARTVAFKSATMSEALEKSLEGASELEGIATRKGIPIIEPFAGMSTPDGTLRILGPTVEFYEQLLAAIQPQASMQRAASALREMLNKAAALLVPETLTHETLRDDGTTSPQNNTSVITLLTVDGRQCLLTGDAGIPAIENAVAILEGEGFRPGSLRFVQVPHHGSRRNVGPTVLDRLLGSKGQTNKIGTAFVSAPAKNPELKHPAKKVTNAFLRRGYPVHLTQGVSKWHYHEAPERSGYTTSTPEPFHSQVEEDSEG
jgi:beta-lactamase superfamily II metal-dependent hydrolase